MGFYSVILGGTGSSQACVSQDVVSSVEILNSFCFRVGSQLFMFRDMGGVSRCIPGCIGQLYSKIST
jgi:hypothetical protein